MKTMKYILFICSAVLLAGLFSFKNVNTTKLPTNLKITVLDHLGNLAVGATVTLYKSEEDYKNNQNPVASAVTDEKGRVTFKKLEPIVYYLDARKGDMNNNGEGVKISALEAGKVNLVNTVIE